MKKIICSIILAVLLNFGAGRTMAAGPVVDVAAIAQSIGGNTQVIADIAQQAIQHASMIKQAATQGLSLNFWKSLIETAFWGYGAFETMKPMVQSTKQKNIGLLEQERELYGEASKVEREKKVEIAREDYQKDQKALAEKENEVHNTRLERDSAAEKYQQLRGTGTVEEYRALSDFHKAKNEYDKAVADVEELKRAVKRKGDILAVLEAEAKKAGTREDAKYADMDDRVKIIAEEKEEDAGIIVKADISGGENKEWGKIDDMEKYNISEEDYQKFIRAYFYEQDDNAFTNLQDGKALRLERQKHEALGDKIERQRKYLVINTMAHLLQVSATIRRELPIRESKIRYWFEQTKNKEDEITAVSTYANTRIESARALVLYARLQAAKLQYLAAKEIKSTSPKKQGKIEDNQLGKFDLEKYILTQEYVEKLVKDSNKDGVINRMINAENGEE